MIKYKEILGVYMVKSRYNGIDLGKLIMAICVVALHTHPLENMQNTIILAIYNAFTSLAVPFFFIASGFLMSDKFDEEFISVRNINIVKKTVIHIAKMYVVWTLIYLPMTIYHYVNEGYSLSLSLLVFFRGFFFIGEQYNSWPLWYLLSTIYALMVVLFLMKKKVKQKGILLIGIFFLILSRVITRFISYGGDLPEVILLLQKMIKMSISSSRILSGLYYIPIGIYIQKKCLTKQFGFILLIGGFIANVIITLGTSRFVLRGFVRLVLNVLTAIGLFETARHFELKNSLVYPFIRKMSTAIYFIHMYIWTGYYMLVYKTKTYGMDSFLITTVVSMLAAALYIFFKEGRLNLQKEKC